MGQGKPVGFVSNALHQEKRACDPREELRIGLPGQVEFLVFFGQSYYRQVLQAVVL
jgi:hypothetical protein